MDKQTITFSANEQNLVRIGGEYHYSSNKVSYIGAHFDLGANWDGFDSVRAVWFTDRINGISTVLDGEGNCTVPTEVLKKKDRVFVNLVGSIVSNGELTDRLTTYPAVALVVDSKAKVDSTETAPVTPSQFEQFVSIVQDAVANIKDIVSTTLNADYTLTFVYSDGTSYTTPSIRGERGPQGADGADGTDGNGIASAVLNSNYTLTLTFTDGTSYTTPSIRGAQGPKGDPGDVSQAQLDAAVSDLKSDTNNIGERLQLFDGEVYIPSNYWELGNIEYNDGSYTASTTRLRTKQNANTYLEAGTVIKLSNYSDIRLGWARFDSNGVFQQSMFWISGDYKVTTNGYYGFVLQDIPAVTITDFSSLTDKLSILGLINEKSTINDINDDYTMYANGYEYGSFGPATGAESPSTSRIRTKYIPVKKGAKVLTKKYKIVMYYYDEHKAYDSQKSVTSWVSQSSITVNADGFIRVAASLLNDAEISEANALLIANDVLIYPCLSPTYSINKLEQKVEQIEGGVIPSIPDYFESNLESAESAVIANMNLSGAESETFIFATDFHWTQNAKTANKLIKRLCYDNPRVNKLICGGDYINGSDDKATELETVYECVNAYAKAQPNIYMMYGNHDKNTIGSTSPSNYFSEAESYTAIQAVMNDVDYGSYFYFYKDDVQTKTRMIFLDTGVYSTSDVLSDEQKEWLNSVLSDAPNGWHIIVFAHVIYNADNWQAVPLVLSMSPLMTEVCTILDSFNAQNNGAKVEAIIGGHAHCDYNSTTSGGIPIVLTDTCSLQALNGGTATLGTITETAFDVITVDYANEVVRCARIGRGDNRNISY